VPYSPRPRCHSERALAVRLPFLGNPKRRDLFLDLLEQTRPRYRFVMVGYVVMPEHFNLLISEPQIGTPSTVMQVLKQRFSRRVSGEIKPPVWQERFYDFNLWTEHKRIEKLRYMHRNSVKRGLVGEPQEWVWSSFRYYLCGAAGQVRVNDSTVTTLRVRPPAA
jgi:REP-associated tyrosine transposase